MYSFRVFEMIQTAQMCTLRRLCYFTSPGNLRADTDAVVNGNIFVLPSPSYSTAKNIDTTAQYCSCSLSSTELFSLGACFRIIDVSRSSSAMHGCYVPPDVKLISNEVLMISNPDLIRQLPGTVLLALEAASDEPLSFITTCSLIDSVMPHFNVLHFLKGRS